MNWRALGNHVSALGESPFWHPVEQRLYWVDIPGMKILRCDGTGGAVQEWPMREPALEPGCIAPAAGGGLVLALRDGMYRATNWGGEMQLLMRFAHDTATTRFNDGKADPPGRFWAGTMYEPRDRASAELFSLDCRSGATPRVQRMAGNATIANGLAWSPDGSTVYWSDTARHVIWAWDWDAQTNDMQRQRVFHQFADKPANWQFPMPGYGGRPDGAAVDAQGNYWVAMYEGARVLKLSSEGQVLLELALPAQCPTMPCFGGEDLRTLYVTTARIKRSAQELALYPQSGCVLSTRVDVPGLPVNFFQD